MAIPPISELTVLQALWKQHRLSARALHEHVEAELDFGMCDRPEGRDAT